MPSEFMQLTDDLTKDDVNRRTQMGKVMSDQMKVAGKKDLPGTVGKLTVNREGSTRRIWSSSED